MREVGGMYVVQELCNETLYTFLWGFSTKRMPGTESIHTHPFGPLLERLLCPELAQ